MSLLLSIWSIPCCRPSPQTFQLNKFTAKYFVLHYYLHPRPTTFCCVNESSVCKINCCRFLREELSSTQVDLIKSRSEVKVLLEELGAYKTLQQPGHGAQFPNLLLSSLDKLFEDKQQQLWLVLTQSQFT